MGGGTATALPSANTLKQSVTDGLGVDTASRLNFIEDPHEVSPGETLRIDFSGVTGDNITGVWLTKLFDEAVDDSGSVQLFPVVGPSVTFNFTGVQTPAVNPLGDFYVDFGGALDITRADFKATGSGIGGVLANRDYSVAGFTTVTPKTRAVPDAGSTLLLLGSVISGIGLMRRKFLK